MSNQCQATIQQGPRKGEPCENRTDGTYCAKHARVALMEEAKENGVRYCDVARGCFAVLEEHQVKCKICLHKARIQDRKRDGEKRSDPNLCLDCGRGLSPETRAKGKHDKLLRRCIKCYETMQKIESTRPPRERNYKVESFQNKHVAWNHYVKGAKKRHLDFTLSKTLFESLLVQPCFYCGHHIPQQIHGIDRVDNDKGYVEGNVVTCCETCNILKGTNHPQEFIDKLRAIHTFIATHTSISPDMVAKWCTTFLSKTTPAFTTYQKGAVKRNLVFELTKEQFDTIVKQRCYLCGLETSDTHTNGIDRHDNNVGYVMDNCRSCCGHCNFMKRDAPYHTLVQIAEKVSVKYEELTTYFQSYDIPIRTSKIAVRPLPEMDPVLPELVERIYKPVNEIIHPSSESAPLRLTIQEKRPPPPPKQWKVKQIYEAIQQNQENQYKDHCEQHNDLSKLQVMKWATFVLAVKGRPLSQVEPTIRTFVEELRTLRHNQLCYKKNASIVDREDREQWPATTVVRAFLDNKLDAFKKHTETQTGDNAEDPVWQTRWNKFTASLEENRANESAMKDLCSKFLTAQRTKRYRRSKTD